MPARHPDAWPLVTFLAMRPRAIAHIAVIAPLLLAGACIPASFGRAQTPTAGPAVTGEQTSAPATPMPTGQPARPSFVRPTPTPLPTFLAYVVKRGDTLTSIARAYRTTARSIAFWNRAQHPSLDPDSATYAPNRIEVGWILLLVPDLELEPEDLPAEPAAS